MQRGDFVMFGNIARKYFGASDDATTDGKEGHDVKVAACALMLEMAGIDNEFSEKELGDMIAILKNKFELKDEDAQILIKSAEEELNNAVDYWSFTNLINKNYSRDEKRNLIELVWRVVYSDGILDKHEDYLVHKIARLLKLSHEELIDAKLKVLNKER